MTAEEVVDILANMLADVGAKTLRNTLAEVRAEVLVMLWPAKVVTETLGKLPPM